MNTARNLVTILSLFALVSCAGAKLKTPRDAFVEHWEQSYNKVQLFQVSEVSQGVYRGNGIVDGHPVEEYYDSASKSFSKNAPAHGAAAPVSDKSALYAEIMKDLTKNMSDRIPAESRIAVLEINAQDGKITSFSHDLANKIEGGLANAERDVVDRKVIEKVLAEHKMQQQDNALFDPAMLARLGKFMGASVLIHGRYVMALPHKVQLSLKAVSIETTKVLAVWEKEIPLTGDGSPNAELILPQTQKD